MQKEKNIFERNPGLTLIILLLLIIIILDFLFGLIFVQENFQSFRIQKYYYHHGLRPNRKGYTRWSINIYPMITNSLGFRDETTRKINLKPDKRRILFLGDSHTEGVDLPFDKTFTGILASKAKEKDTEILSAAVVSYSPKIHYLIAEYLMENKGFQCDEIYVFIDISDIQNELVYENFNPGKYSFIKDWWINFKNFSNRRSLIISTIKETKDKKGKEEFFSKSKLFTDRLEGNQLAETFSTDLYYSFFTHFDDNVMLANPRFHGVGDWFYDEEFIKVAERGIKLGQSNILKLKQLCDRHNIKLTIAVHPWHGQITRHETNGYYVQSWQDFARTNNIGFINLFPLFINEENPQAVIKKYYIYNDNHWNEKGHQKVAGKLEENVWE